jgi:hypothetical protein
MDREAELDIVRRAYAKQVMATVSVDDPSVEKAFAEVQRENFLGEVRGKYFDGIAVMLPRRVPIRSISTPMISSESSQRGRSTTVSPLCMLG